MKNYGIKIKDMPLYAHKEQGRWVASMVFAATFTSRKKARRILRRLNKHHGGKWRLVALPQHPQ